LTLKDLILKTPIGYSEVMYQNRKYGLTRTDFNDSKSLKVFAQELGGTDFISFNYYMTSQNDLLKPCEMPSQKVIDFLKNCKVNEKSSDNSTSSDDFSYGLGLLLKDIF